MPNPWTHGDSSGANILTDADRRYKEHINELRQMFNDTFYNIRNYGAKIDGVTDDSEAIIDCQDDVIADGYGGTIIFPKGHTKCENIPIKGGIRYMGVGGYSSIVSNITPGARIFDTGFYNEGIDIGGFYFAGDGEAISNGCIGPLARYYIHDNMFNASLKECVNAGLIIGVFERNQCGYVGASNPLGHRWLNVDASVPVPSIGNYNFNFFINNQFHKATSTYGMRFRYSQAQFIRDNEIAGHIGTAPIYLSESFIADISGNWFEGNSSNYAVELATGSETMTDFSKNTFVDYGGASPFTSLAKINYVGSKINFTHNSLVGMSGKHYTDTSLGYDLQIGEKYDNYFYLTTDSIPDRIGLGGVHLFSGAGTPEGSVIASPGSQYMRTDGGTNTSRYVKETGTGNTGWVAK